MLDDRGDLRITKHTKMCQPVSDRQLELHEHTHRLVQIIRLSQVRPDEAFDCVSVHHP